MNSKFESWRITRQRRHGSRGRWYGWRRRGVHPARVCDCLVSWLS